MEPTTAIYVRISDDKNGDHLGVDRQEKLCRKLARENGWDVAQPIYCDDSESAFSRRKTRPAYQRMLDDIRAGKITRIVCWHPDRLHRQSRELVPFIDLINDHHVEIATVQSGVYDLSTPTGRMQAKIVGAVAEFESDHKSQRIRAKLAENLISGKHHGGSRPYGWNEDRVSLNNEEAEVVRFATAMLLAGESVRSITRKLNDGKQLTATGKPWSAVQVRDMINRPRNAGLRATKDRESGKFTILGAGGEWLPIMSEGTYYAAHALLSNPSRRTTPGRDGKQSLLSGIARADCPRCDGVMRVSSGTASTTKGGKTYTYAPAAVYRCRCGKILRNKAHVDALVIQKIKSQKLVDVHIPDDVDHTEAAKRLSDLQARLRDAAAAFAANAIDLEQLTVITAALRPLVAETEAELAKLPEPTLRPNFTEGEASEWWDGMSIKEQRTFVAAFMTITILPTTKRGRGFDPSKVAIDWVG